MEHSAHDQWERFLNPETLKGNILCAAVYIVAFDLLKSSIIGKVKSFYAKDYDKDLQPIETERYRDEVLSLNRSPLHASLRWLQNNRAIDEDDLYKFDAVKALRNRLAHELLQFLAGREADYPVQPFADMVQLLRKIEMWWFEHFEMATHPEDYPENLDLNEVVPGPVWGLQMLIGTALGSHEDALTLYEEYLRQARQSNPSEDAH